MTAFTSTPEDEAKAKAQARLADLSTLEGQASEYRDALKQALVVVNNEVSTQGVQPRIDSVIMALTMLQAEFVAMYPGRNERRMRLAEIDANLKRLVALRGTLGSRPAKVLDDAKGHG